MPVLLLPTHRSYMDFIIISYMFFFKNVPLPAIAGAVSSQRCIASRAAAGDDFLNMAVVSDLLRGWCVNACIGTQSRTAAARFSCGARSATTSCT